MSQFIERPRFSCPLGGALSTITSLPKTAPIIHASAGCGGNVFSAQNAGSGYLGAGYCGGLAVPSSNVLEKEIVFGGENRLREQITTTLEVIDADLFVVITGCMTEIIGDDVQTVVNEFRESGSPIVAVETGGFKGNAYKGYELVLESLFKEFVPKDESKDTGLVNLWGIVPAQDPFWRGDLIELKRLLGLIGLKVNTFFSVGETLDNLTGAGAAIGNIVVSRTYGLEAAKVFEAKHDTPFLATDLPVGPTGTSNFLRQVTEFLNLDRNVTEAVIAKELKEYYEFIDRVADLYTDADLQHYAVVVGNSNTTPGVIRFLGEDLGWHSELVVVTDPLLPEEQTDFSDGLTNFRFGKDPKVVFETNTSEIQKHLTSHWNLNKGNDNKYSHSLSPVFILGSSLERDLATAIKAKHLSISFPINNRVILNRGYAGYRGGLNLTEDLLSVFVAGR